VPLLPFGPSGIRQKRLRVGPGQSVITIEQAEGHPESRHDGMRKSKRPWSRPQRHSPGRTASQKEQIK
jgi:hypothetical protein